LGERKEERDTMAHNATTTHSHTKKRQQKETGNAADLRRLLNTRGWTAEEA